MLIGGKGFNPKSSVKLCEFLKVGIDGSLLIKDPTKGCPSYKLEYRSLSGGGQITACQYSELRDGVIKCTKVKLF
ncbi:MAG: hypothetical protein LBC59_03975 [Chitinispirillales bacterium]|jgi:hypothetical protein|nr:hypothetical protein [Chitinispirillales bacterium]